MLSCNACNMPIKPCDDIVHTDSFFKRTAKATAGVFMPSIAEKRKRDMATFQIIYQHVDEAIRESIELQIEGKTLKAELEHVKDLLKRKLRNYTIETTRRT